MEPDLSITSLSNKEKFKVLLLRSCWDVSSYPILVRPPGKWSQQTIVLVQDDGTEVNLGLHFLPHWRTSYKCVWPHLSVLLGPVMAVTGRTSLSLSALTSFPTVEEGHRVHLQRTEATSATKTLPISLIPVFYLWIQSCSPPPLPLSRRRRLSCE